METYLREALELNPWSGKARRLLALLYAERGEFNRAATFLEATVRTRPDSLTLRQLATLYVELGKPLEAAQARVLAERCERSFSLLNAKEKRQKIPSEAERRTNTMTDGMETEKKEGSEKILVVAGLEDNPAWLEEYHQDLVRLETDLHAKKSRNSFRH